MNVFKILSVKRAEVNYRFLKVIRQFETTQIYVSVNNVYFILLCEPGSSVSTVVGYGLGDQGSIPDRGRGFFLYPLRLAGCEANPVSSTTGTGDLPRGKCGRGVLLTTHPFYYRGFRKRKVKPPLLY
jgi:hypothetical protein